MVAIKLMAWQSLHQQWQLLIDQIIVAVVSLEVKEVLKKELYYIKRSTFIF